MKHVIALTCTALALAVAAPVAAAQDQSRNEQGEARREAEAGNQLKLREIERRILPQMQGPNTSAPPMTRLRGPTGSSSSRMAA